MIFVPSSGRVKSTKIDDAGFVGADLESHPMYLMSTNGMNGILSAVTRL